MQLSRIDLADLHTPERIAATLHSQIGRIDGAVPVVEIARSLDIGEVRLDNFDGFEGMLLTDKVRSQGAILANTGRGRRRARFTVAHELGHFLMEHHVLTSSEGFQCRASDMRETREDRQQRRQETQANRFAIEVLAPGYKTRQFLDDDPDLKATQVMRDELDMSLEACIRRYVATHPEPLAAVWSHNGCVRYPIRGPSFPWVKPESGSRLATDTPAARAIARGASGLTRMQECHPESWTDDESVAELFEQTRVGKYGHAVTLLWATITDAEEDDGLDELDVPNFR
ncbi:MAG: ImmA/IrrE family metallo-endopeptidase [Pseudomonadota bacterium]